MMVDVFIEEKSTLQATIVDAERDETEAADKVRVADANLEAARKEPIN
jgi:hypothetical protein